MTLAPGVLTSDKKPVLLGVYLHHGSDYSEDGGLTLAQGNFSPGPMVRMAAVLLRTQGGPRAQESCSFPCPGCELSSHLDSPGQCEFHTPSSDPHLLGSQGEMGPPGESTKRKNWFGCRNCPCTPAAMLSPGATQPESRWEP